MVYEEDYPRPTVRHLAEYTRTKALAELLLPRRAPDLPLVVARPSIVVGHSRLGCAPSASIFWYYAAVNRLRRVPVSLATRKDIVPVDYVAEALIHLLLRPVLRHRCYHISAGAGGRYRGGRWPRCSPAMMDHGPTIPTAWWIMPRSAASGHGYMSGWGLPMRRPCCGRWQPFFAFSACGAEVFANRRLLAEGVPQPPHFTDYLPACIESVARRSIHDQMHDDA